MLKTIKTTKQMRLDELIKYVWDNGITNTTFKSNYSAIVRINEYGNVSTTKFLHRNDSYTVEVEEEITKDTRFKGVQEIYIDDEGLLQLEYHPILARKSINDVLEEHDEETKCLYIYSAVDGKTELIWEAE